MKKFLFLVLSLVISSCATKQSGDHVLVDRHKLQGKTPAQVASLYNKFIYAGWFREKTDYILVYPKASFERIVASESQPCLEVHFEREDRFTHSGWMTERACDEFKEKKGDDALLKKKSPSQQAATPQ